MALQDGFCMISTESKLFGPRYRMFQWLALVFTSKIVHGKTIFQGLEEIILKIDY